MFSPSETIF